jgi:pimeloyl-ACP methyl ester carboxylesterase
VDRVAAPTVTRVAGVAGEVPVEERTDLVDGRAVRSLTAGTGGPAGVHVVIVPGLGALGYLLPTVRMVAALGARCTVLDLPGFGSGRPRPTEPTVSGIATTAAAWVAAQPSGPSLVLAGHSTGAQAALRAGVQVQDIRPPSAVVLAGPTFAPAHRRPGQLLRAVPAAYRRDSPRELVVVPDFRRGGRDVLVLLRSGTADRPEEQAAAIRVPLVLAAGRHDAFAPDTWLATLARAAVLAPRVHTVRLPGSHNFPYTHPVPLAALLLAAAGR